MTFIYLQAVFCDGHIHDTPSQIDRRRTHEGVIIPLSSILIKILSNSFTISADQLKNMLILKENI